MDVLDSWKRHRKSHYPDAQKSVGTFYRKMGLKSCWEVVGPARDVFNRISKKIKAYPEKNVEPVSSPVICTMYMIGRSVDTARPTIMFCSKEANFRKRIRYAIEKSGILNDLPSVRVRDADRPPDFDHLVPLSLLEKCKLVANSEIINLPPFCLRGYRLSSVHSSKQNFRVFEILPGRKGVRIECRSVTVSLDKPPQYTVILGKFANHSCFNTSLIIYGTSYAAPIEVVYMLELLWSEESPVNVWIDRLCVDHDNASELQAQLDILPAIQNNATTVLWPWEIQFFQDCFTLWKATAGGIFCSTDKTYATTISHGFPNISDAVQDNSSGLSHLGTVLEGQQDNESFEFEYDIQEELDTDSDDEQLTELTSAASLSLEIMLSNSDEEQLMESTSIRSLNLEHSPLVHPNDLTIYNKFLSNKSEASSLTEGLSNGSGTIPVLLDDKTSSDQQDGIANEAHLANPLSDHEKTREVAVGSPEAQLYPHVTPDDEFHGSLYARRKELEIMERKVVNLGISDHNLDYTLVELNNSISRPPKQMICQNDDFKAIIPYPQKASRVPIDTGTYAITGSVCFIIGRLSGTPAFMQIPQICASQELWKVQLDGVLQPGDSGSIVINAENGDIFGHIVYVSLKVGLKLCAAYILPMYKILDNIRDRLDIDLTSPLDIEDRRLFEYRIQSYLTDPVPPLLYMSSTHYDSSDNSHSEYITDIELDRSNISLYADQYEEDFHGQGGI